MNPRPAKRRHPRAGLSLLEVMIVLAIIALVAGLAAPRLISTFGRAKSQAAQIQLANIRSALQLFYVDVGRYPTESENLDVLVVIPSDGTNWHGPYLENADGILDPWGRRFIYRFPGSTGAFDLLSYGRDGKAGGTSEDSDISL